MERGKGGGKGMKEIGIYKRIHTSGRSGYDANSGRRDEACVYCEIINTYVHIRVQTEDSCDRDTCEFSLKGTLKNWNTHFIARIMRW